MNRVDFEAHLDKNLDYARRLVMRRLEQMPAKYLKAKVMEGYDLGDTRYGTLDVLDGRDWSQQEGEELRDAVFYRLCDLKKLNG